MKLTAEQLDSGPQQHGQLFLPFVDASDDGSTPFTRLATIYQSQPVPVLAGTLQQGVTLIVANFDPRDAAYKAIGGNQYSIGIDVGINNDGLLGLPLPDGPVFSAHWHKVGKPVVDPDFFKGVMQAPYQHTYYNTCSQSKYVFNETFASPFSLVGDVQSESGRDEVAALVGPRIDSLTSFSTPS